MTDDRQCCRICRWWHIDDNYTDFGDCAYQMPDSVDGTHMMAGHQGEKCPSFERREK